MRSEVNHIVSNACALSAEDSKGKALSGADFGLRSSQSPRNHFCKRQRQSALLCRCFCGVALREQAPECQPQNPRPINRAVVCTTTIGGSFFIRGCGDDIMSIARLSASATRYPRELGLKPCASNPAGITDSRSRDFCSFFCIKMLADVGV